MRIISGSKRGMKLLSPAVAGSRPITDRVKESLFSVLYKYDLPAEANVADLFCGVGSLGLEALSRGADFGTFVEKNRDIIATLKKNIDKADFNDCSNVIRADAFGCIILANTSDKKYNLVFIDPPYIQNQDVEGGSKLASLMNLLSGRVAENGIIVVRTREDVLLLKKYARFEVIERHKWGTMALTILQ